MITRRQFMLHSALAAAGARSCFSQQAQGGSSIVRRVAQGDLQGEVAGDVHVFRGVPFAEPPLGGLRFRAPRPARRWTGIREATTFAHAAVQPGEADVPQSEDCLYLNLWAPAGEGPFPVFVWIHGGGFTGGAAFEPLYDGTHFAQAGIVCISVAYRLGVFGFLDVSKQFGPVYAGSADNAILDLMMALRWIQDNVRAFGGDPARVTIGGESAGAKLADILMGVPDAMPLFHQVISESGGAERVWAEDQAGAVSAGFAEDWTRSTGRDVHELLSADAREIVTVQQQLMKSWPQHFPLRPEMNERLIPKRPLETIRNGSTRGKRLLIGTNRDESALFLGAKPHAITAADLGNVTMERFATIEDKYRTLYPKDSEAQLRTRSVTAEEYWIPSLRVADAHVQAGGEAYLYRLDLPAKGRFAGYAFHSYDLRFVWEYFGKETPTATERGLANGMHAAWIRFIQGQAPAGPGLPEWPAYTLDKRPTMILDEVSRVEPHPNAAEFALWDGLLET